MTTPAGAARVAAIVGVLAWALGVPAPATGEAPDDATSRASAPESALTDEAGETRLAGRVLGASGSGIAGVSVALDGAFVTAVTDGDGKWMLPVDGEGPWTVVLTLGDRSETVVGAVPGRWIETAVEGWESFGETVTVRAASRYAQRIVDAPAAVTVLGPEEIERRSVHGQLPRLLASSPVAELAQSGLYDFNLNTRGFNGSTNRRVLTLLDGRDPSLAVFSGAQEWATLTFGLDRLESVELVRGPGAALYGAGAYNGVLDLRTRPVRSSLGGHLQASVGELSTRGIEIRHAQDLGRLGFVEIHGGGQRSEDFFESRVDGAEIDGELPPEVIGPPLDEVELALAEVRWESDLGPDRVVAVEAGTGRAEGASALSGAGRLQRLDVRRPWARLAWTEPRWNAVASWTGRDSHGEVSLATGSPIYLDSSRLAAEIQGNVPFARGRGRAVGGLSWSKLRVDSADPEGRGTLFPEPVTSEHEAVFGQTDLALGSRLRAVASLRWDDSDLHDARWSPRIALVLAAGRGRSLRLSWSEAFLSPTISEKNVRLAVAPPLDLSGLEEALAPLLGGIPLGLDSVPLLAVGSDALEAEEVQTWELGYGGAIGARTWIEASVYRSELSNFTSNLIPVLGTGLGPLVDPRLWEPPSGLSDEAAEAVRAALAQALPPTFLVAADVDGSPFVPLLSFGSFGEVTTTGVELAAHSALGPWRFDGGLSWFDHEVDLQAAENPLAPNRGEWQFALGLAWSGERFDAGLDARWSEGFDYRSGIFVGPVPSYLVVDATIDAPLGESWELGLAVSNLLNDAHIEAFGGDRIGRRALVRLRRCW